MGGDKVFQERAAICLFALLAAAVLVVGEPVVMNAAPAAAVVITVVIPATITSVSPNGLVVTTQSGSMQVKTTAQTRVQKRVRATIDDIKAGDFVGAAAHRETDGSLTAVYINIFQGGLRTQISQGQSPMDGGNVMTNAIVTDYVTAVSGRAMTVRYQGGTVRIIVPPGAEITRMFVTTRADLQAGRNVTVRGTQNGDGSLTAGSITINPH